MASDSDGNTVPRECGPGRAGMESTRVHRREAQRKVHVMEHAHTHGLVRLQPGEQDGGRDGPGWETLAYHPEGQSQWHVHRECRLRMRLKPCLRPRQSSTRVFWQ